MCGTYTKKLYYKQYCKECFDKKQIKYYATSRAQLAATKDSLTNDWLYKVKQVPENYPTLTQQQWIEACKYFDGCAFCGEHSIDTRVYFIDFSDGGRYCDWNIIPACEKCALRAKVQKNPFKKINATATYTTPILDKIMQYLEVRLDAAIEKHTEHTDCANNSD